MRKILKPRKIKFEEIFWIKNCIMSNLILSSLFDLNVALLTHLPIASYLSLVYIRTTIRAIREETIFVYTSGDHLAIYTQKRQSPATVYYQSWLYLLHILTLKFIRKWLLLQTFSQSRRTITKTFSSKLKKI